jgi:hypothetical protein
MDVAGDAEAAAVCGYARVTEPPEGSDAPEGETPMARSCAEAASSEGDGVDCWEKEEDAVAAAAEPGTGGTDRRDDDDDAAVGADPALRLALLLPKLSFLPATLSPTHLSLAHGANCCTANNPFSTPITSHLSADKSITSNFLFGKLSSTTRMRGRKKGDDFGVGGSRLFEELEGELRMRSSTAASGRDEVDAATGAIEALAAGDAVGSGHGTTMCGTAWLRSGPASGGAAVADVGA